MTGLMYRPDADDARARLTTLVERRRSWPPGPADRRAAARHPIEDIPALPQPAGWSTRYSTRDFAYRVNLARRACTSLHYLAEAVPAC